MYHLIVKFIKIEYNLGRNKVMYNMVKSLKKNLNLLSHRVFLVPLIMIIQLTIIFFMVFEFYNYLVIFYIICTILSLFLVLHIVNSNANPGYKIAWIIPIMALPIFGLLLYSLFGGNQLTKRQKEKLKNIYYKQLKYKDNHNLVMGELRYENISAYNQVKYIQDYSLTNLCKHTKTTYLSNGKNYFNKLIEALKNAKNYIFLEYFIISEGKMWNTILDILKQKIAEGVEVRVIYDDFGSIVTLPNNYDKTLEKEGIKTAIFNKFVPNLKSKFNNRDHRKIAIIDGQIAFTGGINLADEYIGEKVRFGHWKDNGIMLEGEAVWNFTVMFLSMWDYIKEDNEDYEKYRSTYSKETSSDGYVIPYCDSPWDNEAVGETVYLNLINKANRYLYITTPYLVLDNEMITALTMAAKRGVDVHIITPGIPDKKIVNEVTKAYYEVLLKNGVKIHEYTKGFIHAKTFIIDDEYATIGTVNLDYRSLYLHFECGVWLYDCSSIYTIKQDFTSILKESKKIKMKNLGKLTWFNSLKRQILKAFAPLM